ncbi:hypothetical protein [Streptomyces profundus]|uniref:hypothetical protein n=1 Tax=Streptomyces profundus TaxID=2867410 RepID=UPI001D16A522|nr:hypothetical protein [Streptomyces sp. MA3_2.13]UED84880.1 hypothetical protein K4G22_12235 [Streptomyces sp. MA3_2.13]
MRTTITALSSLAAAALLTVAGATSAQAAEGVLTIDGVERENPSGCYPVSDAPDYFTVANDTNVGARVHSGANCSGGLTNLVGPGSVQEIYGASVFIP